MKVLLLIKCCACMVVKKVTPVTIQKLVKNLISILSDNLEIYIFLYLENLLSFMDSNSSRIYGIFCSQNAYL